MTHLASELCIVRDWRPDNNPSLVRLDDMSEAGRLFAGFYALSCRRVVLTDAGIIFAPVAHRIVHRFHLEVEERD